MIDESVVFVRERKTDKVGKRLFAAATSRSAAAWVKSCTGVPSGSVISNTSPKGLILTGRQSARAFARVLHSPESIRKSSGSRFRIFFEVAISGKGKR